MGDWPDAAFAARASFLAVSGAQSGVSPGQLVGSGGRGVGGGELPSASLPPPRLRSPG